MVRPFDRARRQPSKASRELASTLDHYRDKSGVTTKAFAEKLGISAQYLYKLLDGIGNPSLETMESMAVRLGLEFSPVFRAPTVREPHRDRRRREGGS